MCISVNKEVTVVVRNSDMFIATANVMVLNVNTELMTKKRLPCKYKVRHGSVKTNSFCESCMVVKVNFESNLVKLTCFKFHNHPITLKNMVFQPVSKSFKAVISSKLALGIPVKEIWKDVCENFSNRDKSDDKHQQLSNEHELIY